MLKKSVVFTIGVIFLGAVVSSYAKASDFYGGVKIGQYSFDKEGLDFSGTSLAMLGGYQISPYLAVEIEHIIHASARDTGWVEDDLDTEVDEYFEYDLSTSGSDTVLWVQPMLPLNEAWSLYGKVGWGYFDYEVVGEAQTEDEYFLINVSETGTSFYKGIGIKWEGEALDIRLEAMNQDRIGTDMISLGVTFRF